MCQEKRPACWRTEAETGGCCCCCSACFCVARPPSDHEGVAGLGGCAALLLGSFRPGTPAAQMDALRANKTQQLTWQPSVCDTLSNCLP